jgi:hypothetical protein
MTVPKIQPQIHFVSAACTNSTTLDLLARKFPHAVIIAIRGLNKSLR